MSLKYHSTKGQHKELRSRKLEQSVLKQGWQVPVYGAGNQIYNGEWKNGLREGYGRMITKSNRFYDGIFEKEYRFQNGINCYAVKDKKNIFEIEYRGGWKNGHHFGPGEKHYKDDGYYKGKFVFSKRHGYGRMWYADGSFYCGKWRKDKRHGEGILVETNGNRFEGSFQKDEKHGEGRFFFLATGQYMEGIWRNDICICSIIADIPFRQTSEYPSKYPIKEVKLDREDSVTRANMQAGLILLENIKSYDVKNTLGAKSSMAPGSEF